MSTQLAVIQPETLAALDELTAQDFAMVQNDAKKKFTTAMMVASQVTKIKAALTDEVMKLVILPLKDCGSIGFSTDEAQRQQPYSVDQIRTCTTEAILRGAMPVGGEFMVFQGKTFFQKPYFERKVRSFPGLTNLDLQCSTPRMMQGGALVEVTATFNMNGKPQKIERIGTNAIAVKLQGSGGADMAIGKAEKRMYRFILNFVSGYAPPSEPDDEDGSATLKVVGNETAQEASLEIGSSGQSSGQPSTANVIPPLTPAASGVKETPPASGNEAVKKVVRTVKPKKAETELPPPPPPPQEEAKQTPPAESPENPPQADAEQAQGEPVEEPGLDISEETPPAEEKKGGRFIAVPGAAKFVNKEKGHVRLQMTDEKGPIADHFTFNKVVAAAFVAAKGANKKVEVVWEEQEVEGVKQLIAKSITAV